jgi:hypothetical protein
MKPEIEKQTTKDDLIEKGYTPLTKQELLELISNTTVSGDYEYSGHRRFKTFMNANGEMEGKNDWGSDEFGKWNIDGKGYLSVEWEGYWENWSGMGFKVEDEIKFYDKKTGKWRTTFNNIMPGEQDLDVI